MENKSLEFYNRFDDKLIKDFVSGNKRIESAIVNLGSYIPKSSKSILDIGCGLGWSSFEFAKAFNKTEVLGIDLSPVLVEKASLLFQKTNLSFKTFDLTKEVPKNKFDAIVMIDVYEHIPKDERLKFHMSIRNILNTNGRMLLACPSKYHQNWLRRNKPEGLQPIDENVDINDVITLTKDIGGELVYFEYQTIWRSSDYFYAVLELRGDYSGFNPIKNSLNIELEKPQDRSNRIKSKLNFKFNKFSNKNIFRKIKCVLKG